MTQYELFLRLTVALAIGLLTGLERGQYEREQKEGSGARRITGMRTFGLIGLLGALCGLLAMQTSPVVLGFSFLGLAALMTASHIIAASEDHDYGITTVVASLLTFILGAVIMYGYISVAAAVAVIMTTLLGMKTLLHRFETNIQRFELFAVLKLLLISVVILPVLPNRGYGPWDALNPYVIWWMVVLIAGISFVGYFGVKVIGARRGLMLTGLLGGLASSTALTLHFSRICRRNPDLANLIATGILVSAGTMYPRMLLLAGILYPPVAQQMLLPLGLMGVVCFVSAGWLSTRPGKTSTDTSQTFKNPFELKTALQLGLLLALVTFFAHGLKTWFGDAGVMILAGISGISDVDAINLALARMAEEGKLVLDTAVRAIILAAIVNTLVKGLMAVIIGGKRLILPVGSVLLAAIITGFLTAP